MKYDFDYSRQKDLVLREARGVGFQEIIDAVTNGYVLDDIDHFNKKQYPNQRILIVKIRDKVYAVPYVVDEERKKTFLKTIYPSRLLKKKYLK